MKNLLDGLKKMFYPPQCAFCGVSCGSSLFSGRCPLPLLKADEMEKTLKRMPNVDFFAAPFIYRGGAKKAVIDMKKNRIRGNHLPLARFMCQTLEERGFAGADLVTCVPTSPDSMFEREYNPAQLLAEYIAKHFHSDFAVVTSAKNTKRHQKELSAAERAENVKGKFSFHGRQALGGTLLVIDDVVTTGATMNEIAGILKAAGAKRIASCCAASTVLENLYD